MGYVGTKPADAPLTSSQLDDGIVTAAKLATDSVETAKVKDVNVTAGKLAATQDLSTKTITLPASVAGLGTGITNAQLAGSITDAKITGLSSSKLTGALPAISGASLTALNATEITSGTIVSADRLPTVTAAKGGTAQTSWAQGDVLYASAADTLAKLGKPGTPAGEVLTFATSATIPSWTAPAAGGGTTGLYLTDVTTFTSSVTIDGYFDDSLYRGYEIYITDLQPDGTASDNYLSIQVHINGSLSTAGELDTVGYNNYTTGSSTATSAAAASYNQSATDVYPVGGSGFDVAGNATSYPNDTNAGKITFFQTDSTYAKLFSCFFLGDTRSGGGTDSTHIAQSAVSCKYGSASEVTGLKIYWGSGADIKGNFRLIGINK